MGARRAEPGTMAGAEISPTAASIRATSTPPADSRYSLHYGGCVVHLPYGETVVGRGDGADISIDSPGVSRKHARIVITASQITIEDLGSRNGTWVDESRIDSVREIVESSLIRIGPVWFLLQSVEVR